MSTWQEIRQKQEEWLAAANLTNAQVFVLSLDDQLKIDAWLKGTVYPAIVEKQRDNPTVSHLILKDDDGTEYPYLGAIGGGLTVSFTDTSLGRITKVTHPGNDGQNFELDLTDYENW